MLQMKKNAWIIYSVISFAMTLLFLSQFNVVNKYRLFIGAYFCFCANYALLYLLVVVFNAFKDALSKHTVIVGCSVLVAGVYPFASPPGEHALVTIVCTVSIYALSCLSLNLILPTMGWIKK